MKYYFPGNKMLIFNSFKKYFVVKNKNSQTNKERLTTQTFNINKLVEETITKDNLESTEK